MAIHRDEIISPLPIRTFDPKIDTSRLKVKSLKLMSAGHLPGRTMQRSKAVFSHWAFVYIAGGRGYFQVGGAARQKVEAGTLFCFFPGAEFDYGPYSGCYWDEYYFTVEGMRVQEWLDNWYTEPETVKRVGTDDSVLSKMEQIFMMMESGIPVNLDSASLLLESVLYNLTAKAAPGESGGRKPSGVAAVIDDLSNLLYEPLNAQKVAEKHHISVSTLRRIVHAYTGFPLGEFVHRIKTSEAKKLLLNTDFTVKEIGERLGYADVFYFSRLFKKFVGSSPQIYRAHNGH
ncbi:AraC family transcriptional regulator [Paenibacillus beijingensis]|uniref:Transcriptional regulator n=1 Tax=Paenibacillus beijingensis TaxID=1126833 RepID=A0A0D5NLX2_9BACL|nr:AraC family transcriptional regulator [Paenibacillus beijingensis]AJY76130.1 transcriptional regulator [Paenibacillus beijingensis]